MKRLPSFKNVRVKWLCLFLIFTSLCICYYLGLQAYFLAKDYHTQFSYPYEGDIKLYVDQIRSGKQPRVKPINRYNYTFILSNNTKCMDKSGKPDNIRLLLIIKSAMRNKENRDAIRQSWGWETRFSDVKLRRIFLLGVSNDKHLQKIIQKESKKHGDIVQSTFIDTYFNNTIKTMQGFKWAVEKCSSAEYFMFSDDDMYVSTKNVLRFIRNPMNYPRYLTRAVLDTNQDFQIYSIDDTIDVLFTGFVLFVPPLRITTSKWYVSLEEYPFSKYPPFVTAGAYLLSHEALLNLYYTSFYTKHFRFDDVYLGLVAKKAGIIPMHSENFHFWKQIYNAYGYKFTIASHGYGDVKEMLDVWHEQRSLGNA
uniref:Hexosyltransferase n=1 Tax=Strigamia maritima TaxID=126957 RepID=T1J2D0_STRMM